MSMGLEKVRGYRLTSQNFSRFRSLVPLDSIENQAPANWFAVKSSWYPFHGGSTAYVERLYDRLREEWEGNFHFNIVHREWRTMAPPPGHDLNEWQAILHFPTREDAIMFKLAVTF